MALTHCVCSFLCPPAPRADGAHGGTPCLLSPALFRARVVPVLLRLFEVHEEHVRLVLLSHLEAYAEHFTREQLRTVVLPQVSAVRLRRGGRGAPSPPSPRRPGPSTGTPGHNRRETPVVCHLSGAREQASPGERPPERRPWVPEGCKQLLHRRGGGGGIRASSLFSRPPPSTPPGALLSPAPPGLQVRSVLVSCD